MLQLPRVFLRPEFGKDHVLLGCGCCVPRIILAMAGEIGTMQQYHSQRLNMAELFTPA